MLEPLSRDTIEQLVWAADKVLAKDCPIPLAHAREEAVAYLELSTPVTLTRDDLQRLCTITAMQCVRTLRSDKSIGGGEVQSCERVARERITAFLKEQNP
jgi:hypothetical protein